jgi:pimeloyl-ACP methyl ester carboxylesterase
MTDTRGLACSASRKPAASAWPMRRRRNVPAFAFSITPDRLVTFGPIGSLVRQHGWPPIQERVRGGRRRPSQRRRWRADGREQVSSPSSMNGASATAASARAGSSVSKVMRPRCGSELADPDHHARSGGDYSDWLADVYQQLDITTADVVAGSMGGWIALQHATHAPQRRFKRRAGASRHTGGRERHLCCHRALPTGSRHPRRGHQPSLPG